MTKELGARLRMCREQKGITQKYVSEKLNIGNKTISDYERGVSEPDSTSLKDLANLYGVSANYLIGIEESSPKEQLKGVKLALYNQADELTEDQTKDVLKFIEFIKSRGE